MIWRLTSFIRPASIAEGGQEIPREDQQEQRIGQETLQVSLTIAQQRYVTSECPLSFLVMRLHANYQQEAPKKKKKGRPRGSRNNEKPLCERCASLQSAQDGNITSTESNTPQCILDIHTSQSTISDTTGVTPSSSTSDYPEDFSTPYSPPKSSPYDNQGGHGSQCQPPPLNSQASMTTPHLPPTFPSHDNQGGHQYPYQQGPVPRQVSKATPSPPSTSSPYYNGHQAIPEQNDYRNFFDPNIDPTLDTEFEDNYPVPETSGSSDDVSYGMDSALDPSTEAQNQFSTQASLEQNDSRTLFDPNSDPTPDTWFEDNYMAPETPGSNDDASYEMNSASDPSAGDQFCKTYTVGVFDDDGDNNNSSSSSDLAPNLNTEAQNLTPEATRLVQKGFDITSKSMEDPNRLCAAIERIQREQWPYTASPSYCRDGYRYPIPEQNPHHRHRYSPYYRHP